MKILKHSYILYALKSPALSIVNTLHGRLMAFLKFMFPVNSLERILYIWQRRKQLTILEMVCQHLLHTKKKKRDFSNRSKQQQKNNLIL